MPADFGAGILDACQVIIMPAQGDAAVQAGPGRMDYPAEFTFELLSGQNLGHVLRFGDRFRWSTFEKIFKKVF